MHEVLVNRLGGLSLPRINVVRLTDRPDMTLDVYRGRKTTTTTTTTYFYSTMKLKSPPVIVYSAPLRMQKELNMLYPWRQSPSML